MIEICSLKTNYIEYGEKEAVLFLHGWGSDVTDFQGSAKYFSKNYKTILLDFWGFGKSEQPKEVWGIEDYAKAVYEFTQKINLKQFHLVGHSFGGKVAIKFASLFPKKVKSLTLVDSAGMKPRFSIKKFLKVLRYKRLKKKVLKNKQNSKVLEKFGSQDFKQSFGIMKQILTKVVNENVEQESKTLNVKAMIVWGRCDKETPLYMAKKLHKNIKNSQLHVLEGKHFVHIDKFMEFNNLLEKFWRNV